MEWVEITHSDIIANLPTDVHAHWVTWLTQFPDKTGRLEQIIDNTVREFRDGIRTIPSNQMHDNESFLPQSAVRHCESIIIFTLAMEMGVELSGAGNSARNAADVFLRQLQFGRWTTRTDTYKQPTPLFTIPQMNQFPSRVLPFILAFFLPLAAYAGWIRPDRDIWDIRVLPTFAPIRYTNTTTTLYGHLQGIDNLFGTLQSQLSFVPHFTPSEQAVSLHFPFTSSPGPLGGNMWLSTSYGGLRFGWQSFDDAWTTPSYLLLDTDGQIPLSRMTNAFSQYPVGEGDSSFIAWRDSLVVHTASDLDDIPNAYAGMIASVIADSHHNNAYLALHDQEEHSHPWSADHGSSVTDLAVDTNGYLYTVSFVSSGATTRKYAPDGTEITTGWPKHHGAAVYGVAVCPDGYVYTVGSKTHPDGITARKYEPDGTEITTGGWPISGSSSYSIILDPDGNIYIGSDSLSPSQSLHKYSPDGMEITDGWPIPAPGINVNELAIDTNGYIYVNRRISFVPSFRIHKHAFDGTEITDGWPMDPPYPVTDITVDSDGNLYTASHLFDNSTIRKYQPDGTEITEGWPNNHGANLSSVVVSPDGHIYAGGFRTPDGITLRRYTADGTEDTSWTQDHGATISAVITDSRGDVYIGGARAPDLFTTRKYVTTPPPLLWHPLGASGRFFFPAGDYLSGDGTNLFYTTADGTITNQITSN